MGGLFGLLINLAIFYYIFKLIIKTLPKREADPLVISSPKKWKYKDQEVLYPPLETEAEKSLDFSGTNSEIKDEIYYNKLESSYKLSKEELKKAIVYAEIIGQPASRKGPRFNRR